MTITPARVAALLTALSGVAGAIAVPAANIDTKDAKSVWIGVGSCVVAGVTFLIGNSRWEVATAKATSPTPQQWPFNYTGGSTSTTGGAGSNVTITPSPAPVPPSAAQRPKPKSKPRPKAES